MRWISPTLGRLPWWARFQIAWAAYDRSAELGKTSSAPSSWSAPRRSFRLTIRPAAISAGSPSSGLTIAR